jgi:hypothetical protein
LGRVSRAKIATDRRDALFCRPTALPTRIVTVKACRARQTCHQPQ